MRGGVTANRNASPPYGSTASWNEELGWLNIGSSSASDSVKAMNGDPEEQSSSLHSELDVTSEL